MKLHNEMLSMGIYFAAMNRKGLSRSIHTHTIHEYENNKNFHPICILWESYLVSRVCIRFQIWWWLRAERICTKTICFRSINRMVSHHVDSMDEVTCSHHKSSFNFATQSLTVQTKQHILHQHHTTRSLNVSGRSILPLSLVFGAVWVLIDFNFQQAIHIHHC